jgi:hypothetical protein
MATTSLSSLTGRRDVRLLALAVVAELLLLGLYVAVTPAELTRVRYALYPFVWINAGVWAVAHVRPPRGSRRRRLGAGLLAGLYLLVLLWLAGLVGLASVEGSSPLVGVTIGVGSPGWERVRVVTPVAYATLIPYRVVGYLALSYLVYATMLDAAAAAVSGAIGLVSCISCSFPVVASLTSGLFGTSAALTGALVAYSVDVSTAVFLLAVALLYYRPGFDAARSRGAAGQRME